MVRKLVPAVRSQSSNRASDRDQLRPSKQRFSGGRQLGNMQESCCWLLQRKSRFAFICFLVLISFTRTQSGNVSPVAVNDEEDECAHAVLAITTTEGFKHESISAAADFLSHHAEDYRWDLTVTSDLGVYFSSEDALNRFDVIVFLMTTGDIFSNRQRRNFRAYVESGGAVAGVHSVFDTNKEWDWFVDLLGAEFEWHPEIQKGRVVTVDQEHRTTRFLPETWGIRDEFYNFVNPIDLEDMDILLTVDEKSYSGGTNGDVHPISWRKYHGKAQSHVWVTALGHSETLYIRNDNSSEDFQAHLLQGIEWAASGTASGRGRAET